MTATCAAPGRCGELAGQRSSCRDVVAGTSAAEPVRAAAFTEAVARRVDTIGLPALPVPRIARCTGAPSGDDARPHGGAVVQVLRLDDGTGDVPREPVASTLRRMGDPLRVSHDCRPTSARQARPVGVAQDRVHLALTLATRQGRADTAGTRRSCAVPHG